MAFKIKVHSGGLTLYISPSLNLTYSKVVYIENKTLLYSIPDFDRWLFI